MQFDDTDNLVLYTVLKIERNDLAHEHIPQSGGRAQSYYDAYLKYKTKYLNLKKSLKQ